MVACSLYPYTAVSTQQSAMRDKRRNKTRTVATPTAPATPTRGCLRLTTLCWVGKHMSIAMKPTNSQTQGQPDPTKIRSKVASGPLFPRSKYFFVGWDWLIQETDHKKPNPTECYANTPITITTNTPPPPPPLLPRTINTDTTTAPQPPTSPTDHNYHHHRHTTHHHDYHHHKRTCEMPAATTEPECTMGPSFPAGRPAATENITPSTLQSRVFTRTWYSKEIP